jgi:hypothetical protein
MSNQELSDSLRQQPFEPFRLVLSDGGCFDIRYPDLLWVGELTAYVGLVGDPGKTFFQRAVKVDLDHITRVEPLEGKTPATKNGPSHS